MTIKQLIITLVIALSALTNSTLVAQTKTPAVSSAADSEMNAEEQLESLLSKPRKVTVADLQAHFTYLVIGPNWTRLPKKSILFTPDHLKNYITDKPSGKFLAWRKFLPLNRGAIKALPISSAQSYGKVRFTEQEIEAYKSSVKIIITTLNGNPITVSSATTQPIDE